MAYINGGVDRLKTKKALKEAVKADPAQVFFYSTAGFHGETTFSGPVSEMPEGVTLQVVGPDPYSKRDWYASVTRKAGKIVVS